MRRNRILKTILGKIHLLRFALWGRENVWPFVGIPLAKSRYVRTLRRLRGRKDGKPFRVLFLVGEPAKWKCRNLFREMKESGLFEPVVCLTDWNHQSPGEMSDDELDALHTDFESTLDREGAPHVRAYRLRPREGVDLASFAPDLVFYSEPWGPRWMQTPGPVSRFALTFFVPYFVPSHGDVEVEGRQTLHRFLFEYFALNDAWADLYQSAYPFRLYAPRFTGLGHPALDDYKDAPSVPPPFGCVVYAPHHTIPHPSHQYVYAFSTFDWSGRAMLDYAKRHPEFRWVFKPHPLLRSFLVKTETMTEEEASGYYEAWGEIGEVCLDSDYRRHFLEARLLITDSCSFLTEFGATGKPVLHLRRTDNGVTFLPPSRDLFETYYQARDKKELFDRLALLLEKGADPEQERRLVALRAARLRGNDASRAIVDHLRTLLGR